MSNKRHWARDIIVSAAVLVIFSAISAFLLFSTHSLTAPAIERAERALKNTLLAQTLPADRFDNDLSQAERPLATDPLLGLKRPGSYFIATLNGQPSAIILEASAPDGYAGEIKLLIGILADGSLGGVRVASHHETPGLADFIEANRSPWIHQFNGKTLQHPTDSGWQVKKDGGQFDAVAGATVTPRAIVKAVHRALRYFEHHRATLLTPETAP